MLSPRSPAQQHPPGKATHSPDFTLQVHYKAVIAFTSPSVDFFFLLLSIWGGKAFCGNNSISHGGGVLPLLRSIAVEPSKLAGESRNKHLHLFYAEAK